ncbi:hypothetical protein A3H77_00680 [Candidatus Kaiserbacteria bacterium RIFCSPLOWO2_02_FULL_56_11]|nr:MAG: hypothetical protein A3H77_00680 [Candidatus Kaiserbacteria bacterium RIFCSPLOWO2_02_FULL_56_11]
MKGLSILVVLLIIIGGGWYLYKSQAAAPGGDAATGTMPTELEPQQVVVTYTDEGFSPTEVTVPVNATVTWTNDISGDMWVASAMHPTHMVYDGTTLSEHCAGGIASSPDVFDVCTGIGTGGSWSFTFDKTGTWKYHDHIATNRFGTVIVTEAVEEMDATDDAAL